MTSALNFLTHIANILFWYISSKNWLYSSSTRINAQYKKKHIYKEMKRKYYNNNIWRYLSKCSGTTGHEYLTHSVVEALQWLIVHSQEALSCSLLCYFILQIPHSIAVRKLLMCGAALMNTNLKDNKIGFVITLHKLYILTDSYCKELWRYT